MGRKAVAGARHVIARARVNFIVVFCIYTSCKGQDRIFSLSSAIESDLEGYGELVSQWELRYVLRT